MATRNPLSGLLGRSPIGPIQEHMKAADEAAQLLPDMFRASADDDWEKAAEVQKAIAAAEGAADKLKRSVRRHLPKSLFLPVPRSDLLELVSIQDAVANTARDIAGLVLGRRLRYPEKLQNPMVELAETSALTSNQALKAIQELDELLEVGFTGREVKRVEEMLKELDRLERSADKQEVKVRAKLFKMEADLFPVDVMFQYQIIGLLGNVANCAESVGHRLQILLAK